MFWTYLGELFRRVFFPTTRGADYISLLVPLAVATTGYFGFKVSDNAITQILAYVGIFTVLMFFFRLLISGPYGMWVEEVSKVGALQAELSKPETAVLVHMAKHRAKARTKLAARLDALTSFGYVAEWSGEMTKLFTKKVGIINKLRSEAGLGQTFDTAFRLFTGVILEEGRSSNESLPKDRRSQDILVILQSYLFGEITGELLLIQLHRGTEIKTQP